MQHTHTHWLWVNDRKRTNATTFSKQTKCPIQIEFIKGVAGFFVSFVELVRLICISVFVSCVERCFFCLNSSTQFVRLLYCVVHMMMMNFARFIDIQWVTWNQHKDTSCNWSLELMIIDDTEPNYHSQQQQQQQKQH